MSLGQRFMLWWRRQTAPCVIPPGCAFPALGGVSEEPFAQGVEILDDDQTPLLFVQQVLQAELGLTSGEAAVAAALAHARGGVLLPLADVASAAAAASALTEAARQAGWPLRCRVVVLEGGQP
ncbi:ATP-dependent Clp protease adaptor ClpS [Azonexus sp.]|uniref:ATP-dependent Clp protease adaptor ClpS n=1 Tax=Azonexus sp. TaxID=1872668 RepID=UPI0035B1E053